MINNGEQKMLQKAVLEITDERPDEIQVTAADNKNSLGFGGKNLDNKAANRLSGQPASATESTGKEVIRFVVQFNPTQLRIAAEGDEEASSFISDLSGSSRTVTERPLSARARVSFKLIFDDTDNEDAFLYESTVLHPSDAGKRNGNYYHSPGGLMEVKRRKGKKEHTVRHQVEGFLAALRQEHTRKIRFIWGALCYSGYLNTISAEYTMFNPDGNPIRAEVQIGILCMDEKQEKGNMGQWQKHYDAFAKNYS